MNLFGWSMKNIKDSSEQTNQTCSWHSDMERKDKHEDIFS